MPKIQYQKIKIGSDRLAIIQQANTIIADYQSQGYELTLRQLYYQFVSRDIIANNMREYKNLGTVINDGRLAGLVDWNAIVDRTRELAKLAHWDSPADVVKACAGQFRFDKWEKQPRRVEIWVEKEALAGIVERVANRFQVPFLCCRGYTSQSEMWGAGRRLKAYVEGGQEPYIIHLGDHDPSGIDMTRDIDARLEMFAESKIEINRIALNMAQVRQYNPPPNPAKITDSRAAAYIRAHGGESWELDALEPRILDALIDKTILAVVNLKEWRAATVREESAREQLGQVAAKWEQITEQL